MKRLAAILCAVAIFGAGHYFGMKGERENAMWAVTVANAKADAYGLATVEMSKHCPPPRKWFQK